METRVVVIRTWSGIFFIKKAAKGSGQQQLNKKSKGPDKHWNNTRSYKKKGVAGDNGRVQWAIPVFHGDVMHQSFFFLLKKWSENWWNFEKGSLDFKKAVRSINLMSKGNAPFKKSVDTWESGQWMGKGHRNGLTILLMIVQMTLFFRGKLRKWL